MSDLYMSSWDTSKLDEAKVVEAMTTLAYAQRGVGLNHERVESVTLTGAQVIRALVEVCAAAGIPPGKVPTLAELSESAGFTELTRAEAAYAQLVKWLGPDGEIRDHGRVFGYGHEFVSLAQVNLELAGLREALKPYEHMRRKVV